MEFELEYDLLNPLYPPPGTAPAAAGGDDSPMSNSSSSGSDSNSGSSSSDSISGSGGGGSSTDESEKTLVSGMDGSTPNLNISTDNMSSTSFTSPVSDTEITPPAIPLSQSSLPLSISGSSGSTNSSQSMLGPLRPRTGPRMTPASLHGLEGDQNWVPGTEDIFESTTSRSRPLLALERLRRMSRLPTSSPSAKSPSSEFSAANRGRRGRRGVTSSHVPGAVGMMDVFDVMGEINDQLGTASDLDTFLKVVVGVIKDLTQFHRVLVYQFDEMWNGQTVAELVDWSQTHDLYKGLHFPASDIPAQVSLSDSSTTSYSISSVGSRTLYDQ